MEEVVPEQTEPHTNISQTGQLCVRAGGWGAPRWSGQWRAFSMKVSLSQHRVSILCICHVNNHGYSGTITKLILSQFFPKFLSSWVWKLTSVFSKSDRCFCRRLVWHTASPPRPRPPYSSQYVQDWLYMGPRYLLMTQMVSLSGLCPWPSLTFGLDITLYHNPSKANPTAKVLGNR